MPLLLPALSKYCIGVSACGKLQAPSAETIKFLEKVKGKELISRFRVGRKEQYLRVDWGHSERSDVHIDVIRRDWIVESLKQKAVDDVEPIQKQLDRLMDYKIDRVARATYLVPRSHVQKGGLIPFQAFDQLKEEVSLSMISGRWAFTGSPLSYVEWEAAKDDKFGITFEAFNTQLISSTYIKEISDVTDAAFSALILRSSSSEEK